MQEVVLRLLVGLSINNFLTCGEWSERGLCLSHSLDFIMAFMKKYLYYTIWSFFAVIVLFFRIFLYKDFLIIQTWALLWINTICGSTWCAFDTQKIHSTLYDSSSARVLEYTGWLSGIRFDLSSWKSLLLSWSISSLSNRPFTVAFTWSPTESVFLEISFCSFSTSLFWSRTCMNTHRWLTALWTWNSSCLLVDLDQSTTLSECTNLITILPRSLALDDKWFWYLHVNTDSRPISWSVVLKSQ